jgi:formylglycine-generating enzyme required for sulfatase activity
MGSSESALERWEDEAPQHRVTLTKGYWLAETPCTQAQWQVVMNTMPSRFSGADRPVERVPWLLCQQFCERLRERDPQVSARLPSEAEWEYACRSSNQVYVRRGGGWHCPAVQCRSAFRLALLPFMGYHALGLRRAIAS